MCGSRPCSRVQPTIRRATSAGRAWWSSSRPRRGESAGGMARMSAALVADDRLGQAELAGEPHAPSDHPPGHERDRDVAVERRRDRRARPRSDDPVVADDRAVDVERDEPDRQERRASSASGRRHAGPRSIARHAWAARRGPARRRTASRADRSATCSTMARPLVRRRSRAGRRRPGASAVGSRSSSRSITTSPSGPPSSASAGSNVVGAGSVARASVRTYGRLASDDVPRPHRRRPAGADPPARTGRRSPTRVADGVLAGQVERVGRHVDARRSRPRRRARAGAQRRPPARPRSRRCPCRRR